MSSVREGNALSTDADKRFTSYWGVFLLWTGWAIGPLVWILHLSVVYLLAPWACESGSDTPLYVVTAIALALALGGILLNWTLWARAGRQWADDAAGPTPRSRFMSLVGLLSNTLFLFVILAQGIPIVILGACG